MESEGELDKSARAKAREKARAFEAERKHIVHIQMQFQKWCDSRINELKDCVQLIEAVGKHVVDKPLELILESEDFAILLHSEPIINY